MIRGRDCNPRNNRFLSRKMFGRIVWKWLPGSPLFVFGGVSGGGVWKFFCYPSIRLSSVYHLNSRIIHLTGNCCFSGAVRFEHPPYSLFCFSRIYPTKTFWKQKKSCQIKNSPWFLENVCPFETFILLVGRHCQHCRQEFLLRYRCLTLLRPRSLSQGEAEG